MKRILTMVLTLAMLTAMGGCTGDPAQPPASAAEPTASEREPVPATPSASGTAGPVESLPAESGPPASTPAADPIAEQVAAMTL